MMLVTALLLAGVGVPGRVDTQTKDKMKRGRVMIARSTP